MNAAEAQRDVLERLLDEIETRDGPAAAQPEQEDAGEAPSSAQVSQQENDAASGGLITSLLTSPQGAQLLSKLPQLLSLLGKGGVGGEQGQAAAQGPDAVALLCALRPYLGERRRSMVDGMMQLQRLQALLRTIRPDQRGEERR